MQQCKLCHSDAILRKSHIVPEFIYNPVYDSNHRASTLEPQKPRRGYRQNGFWDRLLCDTCEGRLGRLESYFADVWFNQPLRPNRLVGQVATMSGLDYSRFKLFHLSILWRASMSNLDVFQPVSLGQHSEDMRQRILALDPGPSDHYPLTGFALRNTDGGFKDDLMLLPNGIEVSEYHVYFMIFGGVFWFCAVSSHRRDCPIPSDLKSDGTLQLYIQDWTENLVIQDLPKQMQKHFKDQLNVV